MTVPRRLPPYKARQTPHRRNRTDQLKTWNPVPGHGTNVPKHPYGQPGWVAALTPLSVDGMIVAASTTLLADSRSGRNGGALPWALLVAGSVASLAANVAVAEPTLAGRVIAAWPSFALTASYELLTRQVRRSAADLGTQDQRARQRPRVIWSSDGFALPRRLRASGASDQSWAAGGRRGIAASSAPANLRENSPGSPLHD